MFSAVWERGTRRRPECLCLGREGCELSTSWDVEWQRLQRVVRPTLWFARLSIPHTCRQSFSRLTRHQRGGKLQQYHCDLRSIVDRPHPHLRYHEPPSQHRVRHSLGECWSCPAVGQQFAFWGYSAAGSRPVSGAIPRGREVGGLRPRRRIRTDGGPVGGRVRARGSVWGVFIFGIGGGLPYGCGGRRRSRRGFVGGSDGELYFRFWGSREWWEYGHQRSRGTRRGRSAGDLQSR